MNTTVAALALCVVFGVMSYKRLVACIKSRDYLNVLIILITYTIVLATVVSVTASFEASIPILITTCVLMLLALSYIAL